MKEAEARAKAAEEARRLESQYHVGMPGAQASGDDIKSWIESFRSNFLVDDIEVSGERRLKDGHGLTKEVLLEIGQRMRVWATTPSLVLHHSRIKSFLGELNGAFSMTFN